MRGDALQRVLAKFPHAKRSGDGWSVCCPSHKDEHPSAHIAQGNLGVVMKCFSGCTGEEMAAALGLEMKDLFDEKGGMPSNVAPPRPKNARPEPVSIKSLAKKFLLPEEFLRDVIKLRQVGGSVGIPYFDENNKELFIRRRVKMGGKNKVMQPSKKSPSGRHGLQLYGQERLEGYRKSKRPAWFVCEGESDCWVLWNVGVSAVGIPGADSVKVVEAKHFLGIKEIYIFQEPGVPGETFQLKLGERLMSLGFTGKLKVVSFRGVKDPADLWAKDPDKFPGRLKTALQKAVNWSSVTVEDRFLRMSDVKRKNVVFTWDPYIPKGMITIMAGMPGHGKSFLTLKLAAAMTSGSDFPGNPNPFKPGPVMFFSAEDDPEYVISGRLEDNGADLDKVYVFDLANHAYKFGDAILERDIESIKPQLIVFDPIQSFTGKKVNVNSQIEVRGVLQPLINIARRTGVPILLVAHVSKNSSGADAISAIMGSVDFSAAPRSALIIYADPNLEPGEEGGIVTHAKHNLSRAGKSLRYVIGTDNKFTWRGESSMSASDLQSAVSAPPHEKTGVDDAVEFLKSELLGEDDRPSVEIMNSAKRNGYNGNMIHRARLRLGVLTRVDGLGKGVKHWWRLPPSDDDPAPEKTDDELLTALESVQSESVARKSRDPAPPPIESDVDRVRRSVTKARPESDFDAAESDVIPF